jgi:hypothetical protein
MTPSYRVAIEAAIILWLLSSLRRLDQTFFRWIGQHPLFAFDVGLLLIILYGVIGKDYGLRELFWHDSAWVQVAAGLNVAALLLLLVALSCSLEGPGDARAIIAFLRGARRQRLPLGRGLNRRVQSWIDRRRLRSSAAYRLAVWLRPVVDGAGSLYRSKATGHDGTRRRANPPGGAVVPFRAEQAALPVGRLGVSEHRGPELGHDG